MDTRPFEILPAVIEDGPEIASMMACFNECEGIPWRPEPMTAALQRLLREPSLGLILIARDGPSRAAIGYGVAAFGFDVEFAGRDAFINELFVLPGERGRGVGRELLDGLLRIARERDANAVHLMVRPENDKARALYESRGFHTVPRLLMTKVVR